MSHKRNLTSALVIVQQVRRYSNIPFICMYVCMYMSVLSIVGLKINCTVACAEAMLHRKLYLYYSSESFIPPIVASLFEGTMKRNSKRWSVGHFHKFCHLFYKGGQVTKPIRKIINFGPNNHQETLPAHRPYARVHKLLIPNFYTRDTYYIM